MEKTDIHVFLVEKPGYVVGSTYVCYFWASTVNVGALGTMIIEKRKVLGVLVRFTLPLYVLFPFLVYLWKRCKQGY